MRRRPLFSSDSDASDDDFSSRCKMGPNSDVRALSGAFDDPLFGRVAAAAPFMGDQQPQKDSTYTNINTSSDVDALPQPSKVTATRRNLSQLFGGGPSLVSQSAPLSTAAAATASGPSRKLIDTAIQSNFGPSSLPSSEFASAAPSTANRLSALFAPRFTYEGPINSNNIKSWNNDDVLFGYGVSSGVGESRAAVGLTTALHAVVQAYRETLSCGTCMLALCVPPTATSITDGGSSGVNAPVSRLSHQQVPPSAAARERMQQRRASSSQQSTSLSSTSSSSGPVLLLMSANQQVLCRIALDRPEAVFEGRLLQLQQDRQRSQYLKFYASPGDTNHSSTLSSFSSPNPASSACWWTCMFPDRGRALEFLVTTYTVAQYAVALARRGGTSSAVVPTVRVLPPFHDSGRKPKSPHNSHDNAMHSEDDVRSAELNAEQDTDEQEVFVREGLPTTIQWQMWKLRRVNRTTPYCILGDCVDATAPRDVTPGAGAIRDGIEAAVVGMRSGESRLVFLAPEETRVRYPELASPLPTKSSWKASSSSSSTQRRGQHNQEKGTSGELCALDRPAVAYVTCVRAVSGTHNVGLRLSTSLQPPEEQLQQPPIALPPRSWYQEIGAATENAAATNSANITGALLQQLLLQTLQQQQQSQKQQKNQPPPLRVADATDASCVQPPPSQRWDAMERSLDRVMLQLGSLYEKIDRLDIEGKLQRNNAELELVMKRVVGLTPQDGVAVEDSLKDRDALLATVERYRDRYEEANSNYQRALEAMGRSAERAQALENDLHVQQDLWTRQRSDAVEQTRLKLLEKDVRHRDELERVAEERYAAGKTDGHATGYREGWQAALAAVDGEGGESALLTEWKSKVTARDQQIVVLQTALQDAKFHHERDRRQLRAEIDVLTDLNEKLQHLQANADVRMPEETTQQQCKRVKRILNTVYAEVEAQVLTLPSQNDDAVRRGDVPIDNSEKRAVSVGDVLAVVMTSIKDVAQSAVAQIKADGEQRAKENAELRAFTVARQHTQRPTEVYMYGGTTGIGEKGEMKGAAKLYTSSFRSSDVAKPTVSLSSAATPPLPPPPPPLPPVQTAAVHSALGVVAASLLPAVLHATASGEDDQSSTIADEVVINYGDYEPTASNLGGPDLKINPSSSNWEEEVVGVRGGSQRVSTASRADSDAEKIEVNLPSSCVSLQRLAGGAGEALLSTRGVINEGERSALTAHMCESLNVAKRNADLNGSAEKETDFVIVDASTAKGDTTFNTVFVPPEVGEDSKMKDGRAQEDRPASFHFPSPSPASSYEAPSSPLDSVSPPLNAAKPSRQTTRLPDLPAPPQPSVEDDDDGIGLSPLELTRRGGGSDGGGSAAALSPASTQTVSLAGDAAPITAGAATTASSIEDATPSVRDWQGSRLFTTPPSFEKA